MAKKVRFKADTSFDFGANRKPRASAGKKAGAKRKPSGVRTWKGRTFGS